MKRALAGLIIAALPILMAAQKASIEQDIIKAKNGDFAIAFIGHGSLMFEFEDLILHVDPYSRLADYSQLAEADLVLITHEHRDHLDEKALKEICTETTEVVLTEACLATWPKGTVMKNGDTLVFRGLEIAAVPAYNIVHKRDNGEPFHPKGDGNGYVISYGDMRIYIAGDTENIPEMKELGDIDIAFLPMNVPYTMTPEMVADAARAFRPKVLYPYHFGDTGTSKIVALLANQKDIEVRIRDMK
jgi:L-ascorbate metabolism protein UlaG (beta-lactamase superfamily)